MFRRTTDYKLFNLLKLNRYYFESSEIEHIIIFNLITWEKYSNWTFEDGIIITYNWG